MECHANSSKLFPKYCGPTKHRYFIKNHCSNFRKYCRWNNRQETLIILITKAIIIVFQNTGQVADTINQHEAYEIVNFQTYQLRLISTVHVNFRKPTFNC